MIKKMSWCETECKKKSVIGVTECNEILSLRKTETLSEAKERMGEREKREDEREQREEKRDKRELS